MEASVAEIHAYPARPEGFEEPLFRTAGSRRVVAEHLLRAPWLARASEFAKPGGRTARALREPVEFGGGRGGISWASSRGGRRRGRAAVVEVLDRWREVGRWWDEASRVDRLLLKVLLSDGAVVDLAREGHGEDAGRWFVVGVED